MSPENYEVIDALVDGERADPQALTHALAEPAGRDYLIDVLALRDAMARTSPRVQEAVPVAVPVTWRRAIAWPAAAAVLVVSLGAGFAAGYRVAGAVVPDAPVRGLDAGTVAPVTRPQAPAAPAPTRVIRLESGVDWLESTGGD